MPDQISPELIEQEPWLKEHFTRSVTELEILHGVLNDPQMAEHAFFYFRDPKYLETLPPEDRADFLESASSQGKQKLADLKERIRKSGLPVHENYQNPKGFGQIVLQDLTAIIDDLYPEGSQPDPLEREAAEHEIFARSRAQVYIGRRSYFDLLDAHACSDAQPLLILGESGSGKSALLANWAVKYRQEHPDELVLMHFIGATPGSADWASMLRRILGEFKKKFDIREEIPDPPEALRSAFANWLNMASTRGRVVLILDALNQLEDRDGALDLVWMPPHIPDNVRMLLSTLPGRPLDELHKRTWPVLAIEPLQFEERRQLIKEYLALFTKALSAAHTEHIARASQCQNPLFLRVLLDELKLFGKHEQLDQRIETYLGAPTIPALFGVILERCEQDYERERQGLLRACMSLLWAARRGLSEAELMDLLGTDGKALARAYWSPLYLALEQSFLNRAGLIGFFHDYFRQAVQNRYLRDPSLQRSAHLRLADYFQAQSVASPRRLDELPWQLAQAGEWQRLYTLLGDLEFLALAWKVNPFEVKTYWAQVEADSPYRMLDGYRQVIDHPDQHASAAWRIGLLISDTGHPKEALRLGDYCIDHFRKMDDQVNLAGALGNQAAILFECSNLDGAMLMYKEQERIGLELGNQDILQNTLGNQAMILAARGDLDGAMRLHKEEERICRELGDRRGLQASFCNQANILFARGDLDKAMALYKEQERICRELGNKAGLQASLGSQAVTLFTHGDVDGALALHKEQERICRELGDKAGLGESKSRQAQILYDRGDLNGAMALQKEQEHICRELGNRARLQFCLGDQALILWAQGDLNKSMALSREQERICRELGNKLGLEGSLGHQAAILYTQGNLSKAMRLRKEQERLCRELGYMSGLQACLGNQAWILHARGDLDGAMALEKEEERICRELGYKAGLSAAFGIRAAILQSRGDLEGALTFHKEQELICRELGDKNGLAISLINQASLLGLNMNQSRKAFPLADEAYHVAVESGLTKLAKELEVTRVKIRKRLG